MSLFQSYMIIDYRYLKLVYQDTFGKHFNYAAVAPWGVLKSFGT